MATVIDSLIVEFSLDPTKFTEGQKKLLDEVKKTAEGVEKHSKKVEEANKNVEVSYDKITKAIGEMTAGYLTATGITAFIQNTNAANTAVGQLATVLGIMPEKLARYQYAAKLAGIPKEAMTSTLSNLYTNAFSGPGGTPNPSVIAAFAQFGLDPAILSTGDPTKILDAIDKAYKRNPLGNSPGRQNALMGQMGVTPDIQYVIIRGELKKLNDELEKNKALTDEQIASSLKATSVWAGVATELDKLGNVIGTDMNGPLGTLAKILESVIKLMEKFVELIEIIAGTLAGAGIGGGVGAFIGGVLGIPGGPAGIAAGAAAGGTLGAKIGAVAGAAGGALVADEHARNAAKGGAGGGAGSGASGSWGDGAASKGVTSLKEDRARFAEELARNPGLKERFFAHAAGEDSPGSATGTLANQAIMETAMNRASTRGAALSKQLSYFAGYNPNYNAKQRAIMEENLHKVLEGSDVSKGAIDNSSSWLAAKHRKTGAFKETTVINGESFQIPGTRESGTGDRDKQRLWYDRIQKHRNENNTPAATPEAESWGHWFKSFVPNSWRGGDTSTTNKHSSLSIGNMNFHGVSDMNDVAQNIGPFLENKYTAIASDHGFS